MQFKSFLSALSIALAVSAPAVAADKHQHDHAAAHGGLVTEIGDVGLELVAKADSLTVWLMLDDKPTPSAGVKGSATVFAGSEKTQVTLEPAGDNKLVAKGSFKTGVGVRVAVTVSLPGKAETKANFRLK